MSAKRWRRAVQRRHAEGIALASETDAELGLANARRVLQHGVEHRLQLAGRAADDLEHLRGRGLLLQRLAQIVGALAQLVEQPRVLDGDDGLGGEVLHQLDLLVGERAHLLAVDGDRADQLVVLEHRHDERSRAAAKLGTARRGSDSAAMSATWMCHFVLQRTPSRDASRAWRLKRAGLVESAIAGGALCSATAGTRRLRKRTGCRTWPRRCASHSPAWPRTPAPARRANC